MSTDNDVPKKKAILGSKHEDWRKTQKVSSSYRLMLLSVSPY